MEKEDETHTFNTLDLPGTKASEGPLVFRSGKTGADRTLKIMDRSTCRGTTFPQF